jgi:hypothetical protein
VIKTRQPPKNKTPFVWDVNKGAGPVIKDPFGYLREVESGGAKLEVMPKSRQLGTGDIAASLQKAAGSAAAAAVKKLGAPITTPRTIQMPRTVLATRTREETRTQERQKEATLERTALLTRTIQKEATLEKVGQELMRGTMMREAVMQKQVLETRQLERTASASRFTEMMKPPAPETNKFTLPRAPQDRAANMVRFAKEKKRQPLPVRRPQLIFPRRDPLTREFEGLHRPFGEWGRPLKPLPQTEAARAAYARKLYGPGLATFRFGPEDIRKEMERRAKA